jgi:very-short-patch-repair endonuclease
LLLAGIGLKVLRFDDRQALMETNAVLEVIYAEVAQRLKEKPNPP